MVPLCSGGKASNDAVLTQKMQFGGVGSCSSHLSIPPPSHPLHAAVLLFFSCPFVFPIRTFYTHMHPLFPRLHTITQLTSLLLLRPAQVAAVPRVPTTVAGGTASMAAMAAALSSSRPAAPSPSQARSEPPGLSAAMVIEPLTSRWVVAVAGPAALCC